MTGNALEIGAFPRQGMGFFFILLISARRYIRVAQTIGIVQSAPVACHRGAPLKTPGSLKEAKTA